jgi:hypothetical protein
MSFEFLDVGDISCAKIARQFNALLVGRVAVNTSFDSGKLFRSDWIAVNGYHVSPPITPELVNEWPTSHDDCWDEWWVFESRVPDDFLVKAFCNFGLPISRYKEVDFENLCPLDRYLDMYRPTAVFGNNQISGYLVRSRAL